MIGKPVDAFDHYVDLCTETALPPDHDAWAAGHADGNRAYCRPEHAYDKGFESGFDDMGAYFPEQCPSEMAVELRAESKRGERCGELARRHSTASSSPYDDEESIDALSRIIAEAIVGAILDEESEWVRLECH